MTKLKRYNRVTLRGKICTWITSARVCLVNRAAYCSITPLVRLKRFEVAMIGLIVLLLFGIYMARRYDSNSERKAKRLCSIAALVFLYVFIVITDKNLVPLNLG